MTDNLDYVKLHTGSSITLRILDRMLNEGGISTLIKDRQESGRLGGFGTLGDTNELFVYNKDLDKAKEVLKDFLNLDNN